MLSTWFRAVDRAQGCPDRGADDADARGLGEDGL
jgi:hypothetical protein